MTQEATLSMNDLCLACGLCCTDVVHRRVLLAADELVLAQEFGLRVMQFEEGPGFRLPCPQHHHGRCAVYQRRPVACVNYQCKLLQRCYQGEVTVESAIALVTQARKMLAKNTNAD
jgi:Fe-S-cluster containining protein